MAVDRFFSIFYSAVTHHQHHDTDHGHRDGHYDHGNRDRCDHDDDGDDVHSDCDGDVFGHSHG